MNRTLRRAAPVLLPLLLAAGVLLALRAPLPYYIERPGELFELSARVQVRDYDERLHGDVLFGTVNVRTATLSSALRAAFDPSAFLIGRERLIPEGLTQQQFFAQQRREFRAAGQVAAAVGLRAAGVREDRDLVQVDVAQVGGPSAGLAIALVVYDRVAPEDLLRGRRVVATGRIASDGRIGTVGGVALKAIAARRAGVARMLVPAAQLAEAQAAAGGAVHVSGVATFADALAALRADMPPVGQVRGPSPRRTGQNQWPGGAVTVAAYTGPHRREQRRAGGP